MQIDLISLWSYGFGKISPHAFVHIDFRLHHMTGGLIQYVLMANIPQIIFSGLYLTYNCLYTYMLMEQEWQGFSRKRRPLRVSKPVQGQRSTYFLQLPWRYGVPLLICSGLMHWLISKSIFLANVIRYNIDIIRTPEEYLLICEYSPIAMILNITILLAVIVVGFRIYKPGLPLAMSRSSLIAAVCSRLPEDILASTSSIMWGAVRKDGAKQYVFSSYDVMQPKDKEERRTKKTSTAIVSI